MHRYIRKFTATLTLLLLLIFIILILTLIRAAVGKVGAAGVAATGGVLGVPVAGLIAYKYFGHRRDALPVLIVVFTLWSAVLTTLASSAFL